MAAHPAQALRQGAATPATLELPARSPVALDAHERERDATLAALLPLDPKAFGIPLATDLELTRGALGAEAALERARPTWRSVPLAYVEELSAGVDAALLDPSADADTRLRQISTWLGDAPRYLREAELSLTEPPALFTEDAALGARGLVRLLDRVVPGLLDRSSDGPGSRRARAALEKSRKALVSFLEFLEGRLIMRSHGSLAVGREAYRTILRERHAIHLEPEELVVLGQRVYHDVLRRIREAASKTAAGAHWTSLIADWEEGADGPEFLKACQAEAVRARGRVQAGAAFTLPEGESLDVLPHPAAGEPLRSFAEYWPPTGTARRGGTLWITDAAPAARSRHAIAPFLAHEAYPGRHLQAAWSAARASRLRRVFESPLAVEGWCYYAEAAAHADDAFAPESTLLHLRAELWRTCRVVIDVGLHTGQLGYIEAVSFLVKKARIPRLQAMHEVRRSALWPTRPLASLLGKLEIEGLKSDWLRAGRGDPAAFHAAFLAAGPLPPHLARAELGLANDQPSRLKELTRPERRRRPATVWVPTRRA